MAADIFQSGALGVGRGAATICPNLSPIVRQNGEKNPQRFRSPR